jgi:hypothetical protein
VCLAHLSNLKIPGSPCILFGSWYKRWSCSKTVFRCGHLSTEKVNRTRLVCLPVRFHVRTKLTSADGSVMPEADVKEAVRILVQQFIPLKVDDLKEWENNPEQWINEEDAENDQWEYELRVSVCFP